MSNPYCHLFPGYTVHHQPKDTSLEEVDHLNNLSNNEISEQLPTPDPAKMSRNPQSENNNINWKTPPPNEAFHFRITEVSLRHLRRHQLHLRD